MHLLNETCLDWTMQTYQIFQCIFSYLYTGLLYTTEVYTVSCERANELPNNPQEEEKTVFFFPQERTNSLQEYSWSPAKQTS